MPLCMCIYTPSSSHHDLQDPVALKFNCTTLHVCISCDILRAKIGMQLEIGFKKKVHMVKNC